MSPETVAPAADERLPAGWARVRLVLEYDGTGFNGWQAQAKGERTVQGALEAALAPLGPHGRPVAAGRTDAGVHARRMVVHVDLERGLLGGRLALALNARLPADVRVLGADLASAGWHARFSCCWRAYRYRIEAASVAGALDRDRAWWLLGERELDLEAMRAAAASLVGRHDFAALATREERSTVRTVLACGLLERAGSLEVRMAGESFLRRMVRGTVGALVDVGRGRLAPEELLGLLESGTRDPRGPMNAPPQGLYFERAGYEAWVGGTSVDGFPWEEGT